MIYVNTWCRQRLEMEQSASSLYFIFIFFSIFSLFFFFFSSTLRVRIPRTTTFPTVHYRGKNTTPSVTTEKKIDPVHSTLTVCECVCVCVRECVREYGVC